LFRQTEEPDAFLHEEPSYAMWTPQVHQAPETEGRSKPAPLQKTEIHGRDARATP
jgi:hypothetical protein